MSDILALLAIGVVTTAVFVAAAVALLGRLIRCWHKGPIDADGYSTSRWLAERHKGPHRWTRDDRIPFP